MSQSNYAALLQTLCIIPKIANHKSADDPMTLSLDGLELW